MNLICRCALTIIFMVVVLVIPPGGAIAQTRPVPPVYLGVFGGYTIPQNISWNSKASGDTVDLHVDNAGMVGSKFGLYFPQAPMLAVEFEFNYIFDHNYGPGGNSRVRDGGISI